MSLQIMPYLSSHYVSISRPLRRDLPSLNFLSWQPHPDYTQSPPTRAHSAYLNSPNNRHHPPRAPTTPRGSMGSSGGSRAPSAGPMEPTTTATDSHIKDPSSVQVPLTLLLQPNPNPNPSPNPNPNPSLNLNPKSASMQRYIPICPYATFIS